MLCKKCCHPCVNAACTVTNKYPRKDSANPTAPKPELVSFVRKLNDLGKHVV